MTTFLQNFSAWMVTTRTVAHFTTFLETLVMPTLPLTILHTGDTWLTTLLIAPAVNAVVPTRLGT